MVVWALRVVHLVYFDIYGNGGLAGLVGLRAGVGLQVGVGVGPLVVGLGGLPPPR